MRPEYPVSRRNPSATVKRAKRLRRDMTDAERKLWGCLRAEQIERFKFRKQAPIGRYVADFVCLERMLVIEVDGGQHAERKAEDDARTRALEMQGYRVLRFWNNDVLGNIEGVVEVIRRALIGKP
jgi:very-short-patch-repair endonuclease